MPTPIEIDRPAGRRRLIRWAILAAVLALIGLAWWAAGPGLVRQVRLGRAEWAIVAGRLDDAEASLRDALAAEPKLPRAWLLRARLLRRRGRPVEAERALSRAVELGLPPDAGRREYALLFAPRDFALALGALQRVLKDDPRDAEALAALAEGYAQLGRWKEAEAASCRWLDAEPGSIDATLLRARSRWESGRWPEAEADYRAIMTRYPDHYRAHLLYADCLLNDAKVAEAEPALLVCRRLRPDRPEPLVGLAACAAERGELDEAAALLDRALALDPDFLPALHQRGDLDVSRNRLDRALPIFERIVGLDPRDESARRKVAQVRRALGRDPSLIPPSHVQRD